MKSKHTEELKERDASIEALETAMSSKAQSLSEMKRVRDDLKARCRDLQDTDRDDA